MSNKKQTAVEWYIEERNKFELSLELNEISWFKYFQRKAEIENQAKQMEREQIEDACNSGLSGIPRSAKQYYTETFKTGQNESE
jgi:hypothetical protein